MIDIDVLVPTCGRPHALAVTLSGLLGQREPPARVIVADQTEDADGGLGVEARAAIRVLDQRGIEVQHLMNLPRRGLAQQRQFLLDRAAAPAALFLDDDVLLEPETLGRLARSMESERCGFVGSFVNAPSAIRSDKPIDALPDDVTMEFWDGAVEPEVVLPDSREWERHRLHFAAYLHLLCERDGITVERERLYKVAWIGGCVLYDTAKLRAAGGFSFWPDLPGAHCGEDVVAQLRTMARFGGAGLAPSGAWHLEVPTTVRERRFDAPYLLDVFGGHDQR
jgi:GT2 family glycosyltransferase